MRILSATTFLYFTLASVCLCSIPHPLEIVHQPKQAAAPAKQPLVEVVEDYDPSRTAPQPTDTLALANIASIADADYVREAKDITVCAPKPKPPESYLRMLKNSVGHGLYAFGNHTVRITLGCLSNHLFNEAAGVMFSRAVYAVTLYFTGNTFIANFMYATSAKTCQPLVAALVFYAGAHAPDLVYYAGKTVIKTVQITSDAAILLVQGARSGVAGIATALKIKKVRDNLIEMSILHRPNEIDLKQIGQ